MYKSCAPCIDIRRHKPTPSMDMEIFHHKRGISIIKNFSTRVLSSLPMTYSQQFSRIRCVGNLNCSNGDSEYSHPIGLGLHSNVDSSLTMQVCLDMCEFHQLPTPLPLELHKCKLHVLPESPFSEIVYFHLMNLQNCHEEKLHPHRSSSLHSL